MITSARGAKTLIIPNEAFDRTAWRAVPPDVLVSEPLVARFGRTQGTFARVLGAASAQCLALCLDLRSADLDQLGARCRLGPVVGPVGLQIGGGGV